MRGMHWVCAVFAMLLTLCLLASCGGISGERPAAGSSKEEELVSDPSESPDAPEESEESESAGAESLPPPEAIVLLYTDYLTVRAEQDGLVYEYTYCFDEAGKVFNAIAVIRFPTEAEAEREYTRLRKNSYPNLELEGASLSFCFPRKACPFYDIPYRALEILLEETVYEIVDRHPPEERSESIEE